MYKNAEVNVLVDRFTVICRYIDQCGKLIDENYMDIHVRRDALEIVNRNLGEINDKITEMKALASEVMALSRKYHDNNDVLRECTSLMISMNATIGYVGETLKACQDMVELRPNDISDKDAIDFKMDWRKDNGSKE